MEGLKALQKRYTQCRDGYKIVRDCDGLFTGINLKSGDYIPKGGVAHELLKQLRNR